MMSVGGQLDEMERKPAIWSYYHSRRSLQMTSRLIGPRTVTVHLYKLTVHCYAIIGVNKTVLIAERLYKKTFLKINTGI